MSASPEVSRLSFSPSLFHIAPHKSPYDTVRWTKRDAVIESEPDAEGNVTKVFEQVDVEAPDFWSDDSVRIVASKYFRGELGVLGEREESVRDMIERVASTILKSGVSQGYFKDDETGDNFYNILVYLLLHQYVSFNSPVWFNVGAVDKPQCSACFILPVDDDMGSIMDLAKNEAMVFKGGSGAGSDLSRIRSCKEGLSGTSSKASGPLSFMRIYDQTAEVVKSGGRTRRAAKMQTLGVWHPDVLDFIECKTKEERKAKALIAQGIERNEAYASVFFQNSNLSVRVTDEFMAAVVADGEWWTLNKDNERMEKHQARDIFRAMAQSAWECGDPGVQFDSMIQEMHTCSNTDRIRSSNPCSEYLFLDNTACNLASFNLVKFWKSDTGFDIERFIEATKVMITAMDILVEMSSYPTEELTEMSRKYRTLGLGYANLGSLIMLNGYAYDSDEGRCIARSITSLLSSVSYYQSHALADVLGSYEGLSANRESHHQVMANHWASAHELVGREVLTDWLPVAEASYQFWTEIKDFELFRNAQVSVLAPTGTIALMMDCSTTGIEPEIGLVKYKKLSGGGLMAMTNQNVHDTLINLGYNELFGLAEIEAYIEAHGTVEGCEQLKEEHLAIFDCALSPKPDGRTISPEGHMRMMAAAQPFISGAISKTVNMPNSTTVDEIEQTYLEAWKLGLKCIAIYRDGCKDIQPYSVKMDEAPKQTTESRRRLPDECKALRHRFAVHDSVNSGKHKGYIHVGLFKDGTPGEVFINMAKQGSFVGGLMDSLATIVSIALQYGVPLEEIVEKFRDTRFAPFGLTESAKMDPHLRTCSSILDYVGRYLESSFLKKEDELDVAEVHKTISSTVAMGSGPACTKCGSITMRDGKCWICSNCGTAVGACTG